MAVARRDVLRGAAATGIMTTIPSMLVAASTPPSAAPPPISRVEREGRLLRLQAKRMVVAGETREARYE